MVGDGELADFRRGYYDLLVGLLWREPDGRLLAALGEGIEARIGPAARVHPRLGEGWQAIARVVAATPPAALAETVADEYTRLFLGPYRTELHLYESWYLTGAMLERPLAAVREFLTGVGIEKVADYPEPEDFLAFELEVVRTLITRQTTAGGPEGEGRWLDAQATFLKRHLLVWGPAAARDLAAAGGAVLYRGVGHLLEGLLALERETFSDRGDEPLRSLDEARQGLAARPEWRGPLMDFR